MYQSGQERIFINFVTDNLIEQITQSNVITMWLYSHFFMTKWTYSSSYWCKQNGNVNKAVNQLLNTPGLGTGYGGMVPFSV